MPPHCRETWKGMNGGGGKKEKVSTSFSSSHFYKSRGDGGKQERRSLMLADALRRKERGGKEEKRKLRTQCKTSQAQKYNPNCNYGNQLICCHVLLHAMDPCI